MLYWSTCLIPSHVCPRVTQSSLGLEQEPSTAVFTVITMATIHSEHSVEANQIWDSDDRRCTSKANRPRLLLVAAVFVVGAALTIGLYVGLTKSTKASNDTEIVGQAEDPNSLGCYTDERYSRVMPYLYTDEELTPAVREECALVD